MPGRSEETNAQDSRMSPNGQFSECVVELLLLFQNHPSVNRVILFGSRARRDHEDRSDIDLAVDAPQMDILAWDRLCFAVAENTKTLLPVDLIWLQQASVGLAERIQDEGVVLFERKDESVN